MSRKLFGPFPSVAFHKQIGRDSMPPLQVSYSGELTVGVTSAPFGVAARGAKVADVWMSVGASGKDDAYSLQVTGEVYINGTTCLSTRPSIAHVSGEASQQKTTRVTGDTGIAQAVIDPDANTVTDGDVLTYDLTLVRTASPTTEISNVFMVVELEPIIG
uniref:Uncharacterized protein n=1 Tax=viral metagenome TaxID=1070528 RepID=A0A6M3K626_9ZZZZ